MNMLPNLVDMARSREGIAEEKSESVLGGYPSNIYPYGLCISLTEEELAKINISDNPEVGDLIHMCAIGKVTSVSQRETDDGKKTRVEIQITQLALDDESHEDVGAEDIMERISVDYRKMYKE